MKARWGLKIGLLLMVVVLLLPQSSALAVTNVLFESFSDNRINTSWWQVDTQSTGPTVSERNGRLEIKFPSSSNGDHFFAGYISRFKLRGNFDIYVDYRLLSWPEKSGVRVGIGVVPLGQDQQTVERTGHGELDVASGDVHLAHFDTGLFGYIPATERSGKLRIYRNGSNVRAYYYDRSAATWRIIVTTTMSTDDVNLFLRSWSHDYCFAGKETLVAFDNFTIRIGTMVR